MLEQLADPRSNTYFWFLFSLFLTEHRRPNLNLYQIPAVLIVLSIALPSSHAEHDYCAETLSAESQLEAVQKRIRDLEAMVDKQRRPEQHFLKRYSNIPDRIRFHTGFPSYTLLISFFQFILPHAVKMVSWNQVHRNNSGEAAAMRTGFQCMIDQYFLFLNKIKFGSFDTDLADKFGVSASTVSRIVTTWANFLYVVLGSIPLCPT